MAEQIRNIVFDIGDVLMRFPSREMARRRAAGEADAALLHREIFESPAWMASNRNISEESALELMLPKLPQRLHPAARDIMDHWADELEPIEAMSELGREVDRLGYDVYILSNTSAGYHRFCSRIALLPLVKGKVLSYQEKLMKPDPAIYRRLTERYELEPEECFFIDDNALNIEAAHWCGWQGVMFRGDMAEVRAALRAAGVPVSQ